MTMTSSGVGFCTACLHNSGVYREEDIDESLNAQKAFDSVQGQITVPRENILINMRQGIPYEERRRRGHGAKTVHRTSDYGIFAKIRAL
jgi:hypothetical protein